MERYQHSVELSFTEQQAGNLVDQGRPRDSQQLTVRRHGDVVTARWPASSGFDNPPQFAGHVEPSPGGFVLTGTIRESVANSMWFRIMRVATILMVACAVLGAVLLVTNGVRYGAWPLGIGVVAAPVFALLWRGFRRERKPNFDRDAAKLERGLGRVLGDDASRHLR